MLYFNVVQDHFRGGANVKISHNALQPELPTTHGMALRGLEHVIDTDVCLLPAFTTHTNCSVIGHAPS